MKSINKGLIVSCYADETFNEDVNDSKVIAHIAKACETGGAIAIRTNLEHVRAVKDMVSCPVIGIKKIYRDEQNFRITPTLKEVDELVKAGCDYIAIDATKRERYDDLTLENFIKEIKKNYDIGLIGDVSTATEGIKAAEYGVDYVGTTLAGYTDYSEPRYFLGQIPTPEPDYGIIRALADKGIKVIAEGRFKSNKQYEKALELNAQAVVIGSAISNPALIVKSILNKER